MKNLTIQELLEAKAVKLWHCQDCLRIFVWGVVRSSEHWSQVKEDGPMYCPCCGSFDNVQHHHGERHGEIDL